MHQNSILTLPEKILISTYVLFSLWLGFSLVGILNTWTVVISSIISLVFLCFYPTAYDYENKKIFYAVLILVPVFLVGWALLRGFYTGDAYSYWLPWARELVNSGSMPNWLNQINMPYTSAGPFWPIVLAAVFTVLPASQFSGAFLPIIFFLLGNIVLVIWMQEKKVKPIWQFVALAFVLFNSQTAFWSWNLLTESMLYLSYTLFFYFFEKNWHVSKITNWTLTVASLCFAVLVKSSGLLLVLPFLLLVFKHIKKINLKIILSCLIAALPLIVWLIRNYLIYGNPVFPLFTDVFNGPFSEIYNMTNPFGYWLERFPTVSSRASFILSNLFITFPLVVLSLTGFWKSRFRFPYIATFSFVVLAGIFFIFSASSGMRYIWPYIGILALYASLALQELRNRWLRLFSWLVGLFSVLSIEPINSTSDFISSIESKLFVLGDIAHLFYTNIWVIVLIGAVVGFVMVKKDFLWQYSSVLLIVTGLLHTRWIGNKSFLNTWSFIIFLILGILVVLVVVQLQKKKKLLISFGVVYMFALFFINSYIQAGIYYMRQGLSWPHPHVFAGSEDLVPLFKEHLNDNSEIITLAGSGYFNWFEDMTAVGLNTFGFLQRTSKLYTSNMSQEEVYELLKLSKADAVVNNAFDFSAYPESEFIVYTLQNDSENYIEYCLVDSKQCLWIIK